MRSIGSGLGIMQALADEPQLPYKQSYLKPTDNNEPKGKESRRVMSNPIPEDRLVGP
jgi:hypothetical protein